MTAAFLGWDQPEVHRLVDAASSYLGGRHRAVGHNLAMLALVEELFGRRGRIVFALHVLQDAGHFVPVKRSRVVVALASPEQLTLPSDPVSEPKGGDRQA